jgi:hypothetical protein
MRNSVAYTFLHPASHVSILISSAHIFSFTASCSNGRFNHNIRPTSKMLSHITWRNCIENLCEGDGVEKKGVSKPESKGKPCIFPVVELLLLSAATGASTTPSWHSVNARCGKRYIKMWLSPRLSALQKQHFSRVTFDSFSPKCFIRRYTPSDLLRHVSTLLKMYV